MANANSFYVLRGTTKVKPSEGVRPFARRTIAAKLRGGDALPKVASNFPVRDLCAGLLFYCAILSACVQTTRYFCSSCPRMLDQTNSSKQKSTKSSWVWRLVCIICVILMAFPFVLGEVLCLAPDAIDCGITVVVFFPLYVVCFPLFILSISKM
jgi:hypothetical protein